MTFRLAMFTSIAIASMALPRGSSAQVRPTLEAQEQRSDAIEAALCAAADAEGDSYRPVFCAAQCGCGFDPGLAIDCFEEAPGTYVGIATGSPGSCIEGFGTCSSSSAGDYCEPPASSSDPCTTNGDCSGTEECIPISAECFLSGAPCDPSAPTPCGGTEACIPTASICLKPCTSPGGGSLECSLGFSCLSGPQTGSACASDADCGGDELVRLTGVTSAGSLDSVTCQPNPPAGTAAPINSNDALECISQIEAVLGQTCTPAP
jgi:hypothetical protein